jgi:hypothetical protein
VQVRKHVVAALSLFQLQSPYFSFSNILMNNGLVCILLSAGKECRGKRGILCQTPIHLINATTKCIVLHENDNLLCIKETLSNMKGLRNLS